MNFMRAMAAAIGLGSACLIATLPAQACDERVPGACAPAPAETAPSAESDSAAAVQPSSRRSERRYRNYRSYRNAKRSARRHRLVLKLRTPRVEAKAVVAVPMPPIIKRGSEPTWQIASINEEPVGRAPAAELADTIVEPVVTQAAPIATETKIAAAQIGRPVETTMVAAQNGPPLLMPLAQPPPAAPPQTEHSLPSPVVKVASAGPDASVLRNLFLIFGGVLTLGTVLRMVVG